MKSERERVKISEFFENNKKAREELEKMAKEIKSESDYKERCRFYDRERKKCIALKNVYCDKEEKICAFFKEKE